MVLTEGVEEEPNEFPKTRYAAPTQIVLNGRKIFAKGSNWINPELFQGRITAELLESEVTLAKNANMNILRIWGGSGFCKSVFYDICDTLGIMVWQEFPLACNNYAGTPHYLAILEQEASWMIKKLRRHACLVLWCGGNELLNGWSHMTDQSLALRLLNKLCYDLDPKRPFFMTSPLTGMAHGGYLFYNMEKQDGECIKRFQNAHFTAYTEFSVPCLSSLEQIKRAIPEERLYPFKRDDLWPLHDMYGGWGVPFFVSEENQLVYQFEPRNIEDHIRITQWMQCEGLKSIFEEARRQQPYCAMAINWSFNEPWVNVASNAILEYPDTPNRFKAACSFISSAHIAGEAVRKRH